ncbi:hypothetical protein F511_27708 [Dorcoceras hygrometricum]|uniref:Splicing factor 3B subunit 1-like n=1 Tax=Dorcoceras hygrometricum TaxID=472368 RepID=A0A2Z7BVU1_9LAMI|nr:hypothetical protein F511_27708 [Dorcoceras hygrometricum]
MRVVTPTVIYEAALIEFFQHGSIRDGMVVSTIQGKTVEITEEVFAGTFELPIDGLIDLNEVPKDLVFDARSIFSFFGEQVSTSCKKRETKIEFRLLSDILAKSIFMKAWSFDAVTHERFLMMAAINGGIQINWSKVLFNIFKDMVTPRSKQARDIAINDKISVEDVEGVADESRVKKTPMKKAVSKKRLATAVDEHISKKKSTRVEKAAKSSAIVTVAQEPKRKAPKRRLKLPAGSDDENVEEETDVGGIAEKDSVPARADVVDKEISTADDVDNLIEQVIAETAQFETDVGGTNVGETKVWDQAVQRADDMENWFNVSYEEFVAREADRMVESGSDTDEEIITDKVTKTDVGETADGEQTVQRSDAKEKDAEPGASEERVVAKKNAEFLCNKPTDEELMSIDDFLTQISDDMMLPSVTAAEVTKIKFGLSVEINEVHDKDWYYASLPQISATDKGKEPLEEADVVKGNPAREMGYSHDEVLVKIKNLERTLLDTLYQQDQAYRSLIQSVRQENHNDTDILSLALKVFRAQNAILSTDLADVRKEAKEQKAIIEDMDERIATVRSELLDFRAQAQENYNNLTTQLGELFDYINRGGNDKKGEESSSRRPQPPPDDQNRPSGGSASRGSGGDGSSRRRDDRGGSSKKRHRSSGDGGSGSGRETYGPYGPYKKNAEWWLYGKNQF